MNTTYNNDFNDSEIEIDLKKIYQSLKKGIKWVLIIPSITVIIAVIYVLFIAKPVYTSEAKILLAGSENYKSSLMGLASQFGFSLPSSSGEVTYLSPENLPEILMSRTLTRSILFSKFESIDYNEPRPYFDILFDESIIAESDSNELIDQGINYISDRVIGVKQIVNTNIFIILANTPEPLLSAQVANRIMLELEDLQSEFSQNELGNQKVFVNARLSEVEAELYKAESRLKLFREQNLQINLSPTLMLEQERLLRDIEIQTQLYISLKQQSEQIKIEENKNGSYLKIIDEPNIPYQRSKPKRKLIVLLAGFTGIILGGMISLIKYYKEEK